MNRSLKNSLLLNGLMLGVALLAGCTAKGSSAPPPATVTVEALDSSAKVTWDVTPGVEYWVFLAPSANVTPQNCSATPGCQIITRAVSPLTISSPYNGGTTGFTTNSGVTGLTNGTTFSVSINGRIDNGPGGAGSPAVSFVPRLAGTTWTASTAGAQDLYGVAKGTATVSGVVGDTFVAVGNGGSLYSSADGATWTAPVSGVPVATSLNAATATGTTYVVAGAGGVILTSADANIWTQQTSNTSSDLFAIASNGAGGFVAVGAGGTIIYSNGNGATAWTTTTTCTNCTIGSYNLYGVGYANGLYVAVGQSGTMLKSADGITWTAITPTPFVPASDLKGVAYGGLTVSAGATSGVNTFVVVGAAGALVTSVDGGVNWIAQTPIASNPNLNAVSYGHQFIAVGNGGAVYTSTDGMSWTVQNSGSGNTLFAIKNRKFDYAAVGTAGTALLAK